MASVLPVEVPLEAPLEPLKGQVPAPDGPLNDTLPRVPSTSNAGSHSKSRHSKKKVEGYVKVVIHGQVITEIGGFGTRRQRWIEPASIIAVHFRFLSDPASQRIRHAAIKFTPTNESEREFSINRMLPEGTISLYPDDLWNAGQLGGYKFRTPHYNEDYNSAEWLIDENKFQKSGIPPELTVAMILGRSRDKPFGFKVTVTTIAGEEDNVSREHYPLDTIHIDPNAEAIGLDELPLGADLRDLSSINIPNLCQIGPTDSRETLRARGFCECGLRIL